jgi:N-hydroxyarylamine O-acetyltransferase
MAWVVDTPVSAKKAASIDESPMSIQANNDPVDLKRYCARTGYAGPFEPTLQVLSALAERHISAIPYENIDVLLNRGIDISSEAVDKKLIEQKRGGYCFEQNGLFKRVLVAIGFQVELLAARVLWRAQQDTPPRPRTHAVLRVTLDGEQWLVDVGFGGCVPTAPLRQWQTTPQILHREAFRVVPHGGAFTVQTQLNDAWRSLYELSPEPLLDVDYLPMNWFASTHPSSHFLKDLMVARATRDARYALLNGRFTIRQRDGSEQQRQLGADELEAVLADTFGLMADQTWRPLLRRIAALPVG